MKELQDIIAAVNSGQGGDVCALATVVDVAGSAYRHTGARMLIKADGHIIGTVSGGCLERDVCERGLSVIASGKPEIATYDSTSDADIIWGLGLACNGIVRVLIEPIRRSEGLLSFLGKCLEQRKTGVVATVIRTEGDSPAQLGSHMTMSGSGSAGGDPFDPEIEDQVIKHMREALADKTSFHSSYQTQAATVDVLFELIQPPMALFIFGAGYDAIPLAGFAGQLGWQVTVIDHRAAYASRARFPSMRELIVSPAENALDKVRIDDRSAAVIMTHNYMQDLQLLRRLLPAEVPYLGLLGPRGRTEKLLQDLNVQDGISRTDAMQRLHAPVGIDIGADSPEEIALSILAEIKAVFADRRGGFLRDREAPIHSEPEEIKRTDVPRPIETSPTLG